MECIGAFFDRVLIVKDLFSSSSLADAEEFFNDQEESLAFLVNEKQEKVYDEGTGVYETPCASNRLEYEDRIESCDLVPKPTGFDAKIVTKKHRMEVGGKMNTHTDDPHGIAITTYLSDCEGGELVVLNPQDSSQYVKVKPQRGLTVILKCATEHYVCEVKDGTRVSLQTFIDFYPRGENSHA